MPRLINVYGHSLFDRISDVVLLLQLDLRRVLGKSLAVDLQSKDIIWQWHGIVERPEDF